MVDSEGGRDTVDLNAAAIHRLHAAVSSARRSGVLFLFVSLMKAKCVQLRFCLDTSNTIAEYEAGVWRGNVRSSQEDSALMSL